jgi:hypothetical protein
MDTAGVIAAVMAMLAIWSGTTVAAGFSPTVDSFSIERADCARPASASERRLCEITKRLDQHAVKSHDSIAVGMPDRD